MVESIGDLMIRYLEGGPLPSLYSPEDKVTDMELILVGYNYHSWSDKDSNSNRPGSCLISKSVLFPCAAHDLAELVRAPSSGWTEPTGLDRPNLSREGMGGPYTHS